MILEIAFLMFFLVLIAIIILVVNRLICPKKELYFFINEKKYNGNSHQKIYQAFTENGMLLSGSCGGKGTCGLCKCQSSDLPILATEEACLNANDLRKNWHLACQHLLQEGVTFSVSKQALDVKNYTLKILEMLPHSPEIIEIKIEKPLNFDLRIGHYVEVLVPKYAFFFQNIEVKNAVPISRAYSILDVSEKSFSLLVALVNYSQKFLFFKNQVFGLGSVFLHSKKVGDLLDIRGAFGDFKLQESSREKVFFAGGVGIAAIKPFLEKAIKSENICSLWYGVRNEKAAVFTDFFKNLKRKSGNFSYNIEFSERGKNIDDYFADNFSSNNPIEEIEFYLCGPLLMQRKCIEKLLRMGAREDFIFSADF